MLVCCVSDLHGSLPEIPDCDLLLIGGDLCGPSDPNTQYNWLASTFKWWVEKIVSRGITVVGVEGNHGILAGRYPQYFKEVSDTIPWTYLEDSYTRFNEKIIYGTPSSLPFGTGWSFNVPEKDLEEKFSYIPPWTDIIISHGPPYGFGDDTFDGQHVGSKSLLKAIERIQPKLVCTGHLHFGYGVYNVDDTIVVNAAHMDDNYRPVNKPILVEI
jgi:Icc-related predicted phosphoesterase